MSAAFRELVIWFLFWMAPMTVVIIVAHFCLSAPARRHERARLFLDLLDTGLQAGHSPERTVTGISDTRDRSVTAHFHLLAAHIEEGLRFDQALHLTPRLLPRGVAEVVKIGVRENTLPRLLPAARAMLTDVNSRIRGAVNYVMVFMVVVVPGIFFILPLLAIFIWPKLKQVLADMEVPIPAFTATVFDNFATATTIPLAFAGLLIVLALLYVGGSRVTAWTRVAFGSIPDRLVLFLPWRRDRVHRDFTAVLAILLDAGLKETDAVKMAAQASANDVFENRAAIVVERLRAGVALPEALKAIERNKEFQWRWVSALRTGEDFFAALRGWHESLEARAFQKEQAAAHVITSTMVLINGALVGVIMVAVFLILISVIEEGILW